MKYKYIIWDWNGTLFDDIQISIDAMNEMLEIKEYNKRIDADEYKHIFCFPVIDYYKNVGFDFSRHSFDELAQLYIQQYTPKQKDATLFDNAKSVLEIVYKANIKQAVISVCEKKRLAYQMGLFGIDKYFVSAIGTDDNYAVSKVDIAKKWLDDNKINSSDVLFVGDTVHDYEVANACNCYCILVSAGHQAEDVLKKTGAIVLNSLSQLPNYIL